jgi:hypothetical protein
MKVRMLKMTYDSNFGWLQSNKVIDVSEETALRWQKRKIAIIEETETIESIKEIDIETEEEEKIRQMGKELKIKNYHKMNIENLVKKIEQLESSN